MLTNLFIRLTALALAAMFIHLGPRVAVAAEQVNANQSGAMELSLDEALSMALKRSEEVSLAREGIELASRNVQAVRSELLPQLDATVSYANTIESRAAEAFAEFEGGAGFPAQALGFAQEHAYSAEVIASQLLYSGGRVAAALRAARLNVQAAKLDYREEYAELELQVRSAYYQALLAQELERSAAAALRQAESFLQQERQRRAAGYASELDVLRAEVSLANLQPQLVEARNAAQLASLNLKRLVNVPLEDDVRLSTELTAPSAAQIQALALSPADLFATRAAIEAAQRQVEIREQQVRQAQSAYLPAVSLQTSYGSQVFPSDAFDLSGTEWEPDWTVSVAVRVPIFSGFRRQSEVAQARAQLRQARLQLAQLRESVQLEYQQALGERARALASIEARQRTIEQARRVYDLTVLRYEQGQATQLEIADARLELLQARTNLAQALTDFHVADAQLERAITQAPVPRSGASGGAPR